MKIMLNITPPVVSLLKVLSKRGDVKEVVERLIHHAQQGVDRPGAWERRWICEAFGDEWSKKLEPGDPYGRPNCQAIFQKSAGRGA